MEYRIRERRKALSMTQAELAQKSGVSRATISGLEHGRVMTAKTDTIIKIAEALDCKVSDIFLS